jgi:hypothetical protein
MCHLRPLAQFALEDSNTYQELPKQSQGGLDMFDLEKDPMNEVTMSIMHLGTTSELAHQTPLANMTSILNAAPSDSVCLMVLVAATRSVSSLCPFFQLSSGAS